MTNKFSFFLIALIAISFILSSCEQKKESPILKEKFDINNLPQLVEKIQNDKDLSDEEINIINAGISSNANRIDSLNGKTLKEIIDTYMINLKKISINKFINTAIALNVSSRYIGWIPDTTNKTGIDAYKIILKNNSKKVIKRVEGRLSFITNQNQIMGIFDVNLTVKIPAGEQRIIFAKTQNTTEINTTRIRQILETQPNILFAQWQVVEVEFDDGELISLLKKPNKAE